MNLKQQRWIFTENVIKLISYINSIENYNCAISYVVRSEQEQQRLYNINVGSKISQHTKGLAIDILIYNNGVYLTDTKYYEKAGIYWKNLDNNNIWGGDFKHQDGNHFERR